MADSRQQMGLPFIEEERLGKSMCARCYGYGVVSVMTHPAGLPPRVVGELVKRPCPDCGGKRRP